MVFHGTGKLKTLMIFPSLFKGEHVKHTEAVTLLVGKEITVEFDRPAPLQIDGETITDVTSYTVTAKKTTLFNSEFGMRNAELAELRSAENGIHPQPIPQTVLPCFV